MAAGEPCHNCDKECGWWTPNRKWIFFILGVLIAAILSVPQFGTADYVIGMLSRWWI